MFLAICGAEQSIQNHSKIGEIRVLKKWNLKEVSFVASGKPARIKFSWAAPKLVRWLFRSNETLFFEFFRFVPWQFCFRFLLRKFCGNCKFWRRLLRENERGRDYAKSERLPLLPALSKTKWMWLNIYCWPTPPPRKEWLKSPYRRPKVPIKFSLGEGRENFDKFSTKVT